MSLVFNQVGRLRGEPPSAPGTGRRRGRGGGRHAPAAGRRSGASGPAGWVAAVRAARTSTVLLVIVGALCVIGVVMVGAASGVASIAEFGSAWGILARELIWMACGAVALVVGVSVDYRRWARWSPWLLVGTFGLLAAVLVPGIGERVMGSSRWLGLGEVRVQPSELMKLALALYGAHLLVLRAEQAKPERMLTRPLLLVTAAAAGLIVIQPDLGTALVVCCIALALLFASGVSMGPVLKGLGALAGVGLLAAMTSSYRRARIESFLGFTHTKAPSYQVTQSLIGLGSGHLVGMGLGAGREAWGYLPNAQTDFIYSIVGEELGLLGALVVLALLGGLAWFGLRAAARAPDRFGGLVAVALVAWLSAETVINIGAVVGLLPVTGIPLPFISFGGTSLVITMLAAGILVNIARHETAPGLAHRAGDARAGAGGRGLRALAGSDASSGRRRTGRPG